MFAVQAPQLMVPVSMGFAGSGKSVMPPFTGPSSSPLHPGLWFFGLDRSIYGNMHVHRRQARQLAQMITR